VFREARSGWVARVESGAELPVSEQLGVMVSEGRVALRAGRVDEAIAALLAALHLADRADHRELELELHDLLAVACKQAGRLSEALEHRERHFALHRELFNDAADLRRRTVQVAHDNENARHLGEITRLTTSGLVADFAAHHTDVDAYHLEAYERLAALAELRGGNTTRHTNGVGDLAAEIGHAIGGRPEWCERLRLAARLHDIGKVAVNDRVLLKPGPLTVEEYDEIKQHTVLGRRLLSGVSTELFALAAEAAWSHHEWWDGSGYPNGLAGAAIPLSGRIVAIADVFDSLSTRRVYKREWTRDEAVRFVVSGSGSQFDPDLVDAFVKVLVARYPELDAAPDRRDRVRTNGQLITASAERVDHPPPHELREVVDGDVVAQSAVAVRVGERRHRAEHADGDEIGGGVGDRARPLAVLDETSDVVEVDPGTLGEHVGDLGIAAFDVEEREVCRMVGHEPHARFRAVRDAGDRVGRRIHGGALGAPQAQAHRAHQFGEQRTLRREVPVEQPLRDARRSADVGDPGARVSPVGEELGCRVEQLLLAFEAVLGVLAFIGGVDGGADGGVVRTVEMVGAGAAHVDSPTET
jgi:response regulator RpfG family c-di-GMP phosphodiesterase